MGTANNWQVPTNLGLTALRQAFRPHHRLRARRPESGCLHFYDSFEWQLWFGDRLLCREEDRLMLCRRDHDWIGPIEHECHIEGPLPRFPDHLPDTAMASRLAAAMPLRALLPIASVRYSERTLEVLDDENKTVVRFQLTTLFPERATRTPFYRVCRFSPLRGYDAELAATVDTLRAHGVTPIEEGPLAAYFEAFGNGPEAYTTKPLFGLTPDLAARRAVRRIVRAQLQLARRNESGVIDDLDTEFLHDYRVSLRKIRSALGLVRGVYPPDETRRLSDAFSALMRETNRLRDLDVYLLERDDLLALLPETLQPGLETMFSDFREAATAEQARLAAHLRSDAYQRSVEDLERMVNEPDDLPPSTSSESPIVSLVSERIRRRYRKIRRVHGSLGPSTPDSEVHRLRLDCKKLRYLLELFRELYDPDDLEALLKPLKRLQDCLGEFNDCSVQQEALLAYLNDKETAGGSSRELAMAVGGLIAVLSIKQRQKREEVAAVLGPFCARRVRKSLDHMLTTGEAAAP